MTYRMKRPLYYYSIITSQGPLDFRLVFFHKLIPHLLKIALLLSLWYWLCQVRDRRKITYRFDTAPFITILRYSKPWVAGLSSVFVPCLVAKLARLKSETYYSSAP